MNLLKREIYDKLKQELRKPEISLLLGARQVGKTSLLKMIYEKHPGKKAFFDLEMPETLEIFSSHSSLLRKLEIQGFDLSKKLLLCVDEFQYIPQGTKLFKILHDHYPRIKVMATGSSALKMRMFLDESMTGRKRIHEMHTLNAHEYVHFCKPELDEIVSKLKVSDDIPKLTPDLHHLMLQLVILGGYPKPALMHKLEEKTEELREIHRSFLQKDIMSLVRNENYVSFERLMKHLAVQSAQLCNTNEIAKSLAMHRSTVARMMDLLEACFMVKLLPPFFSNRQKEQVKMPKLYFLDNGMRNSLINDFRPLDERPDAGALIEDFAFSEINKHRSPLDDLYFWRAQSGAEVDFVVNHGGKLFPMEVKRTAVKAPRALQRFIQIYKPRKAAVITFSPPHSEKYEGCEISFFHPLLISLWLKETIKESPDHKRE
jgi:hypothetical protein